MRRIVEFIMDHMPTWCAICQYVGFSKNMRRVPMTIGRAVPLCPKCHDDLFHPYTQ